MSNTKNAKRNIIWGILNKITMIGMPFLLRTVVVYSIGSNYLGLDSLFTSVLQMLNITEMGFSSAMVFSMYKPLADDNSEEVCALLNLYKKVYWIIGIVVCIIGVTLIPFLPSIIKSGIPADINLYVLYLMFLTNTVLGYWLFAYKKSLLSACRREDVVSKITTLTTFLKTVIQFFVLLLFKNYYIFVGIMIIATLAENVLAQFFSNKLFRRYSPKGSVRKESIHSIIQRIKGLFIQKICGTSRNSLDNIIISKYLGLAIVASYGNYYYILSAVHGVIAVATQSILAIVGNTVVINSPESNYNDMLKYNFMYMWLASFCTSCLLCIYQPFIVLWMGEGMLLSKTNMVLLCIYFYALCMGDVRSTYYNASGLWWEGRYRSLAEAISNIILNIVWGKIWGLTGVIAATLFSIIVINFGYGSTIIHKYYFKGISSARFYLEHLYYAFITVLSSGVCYRLCMLHSFVGIKAMFTNLVICVIATNTIWLLFSFRKQEFKQSVELLKRIL